tara:strand:+ start:484 stop:669 length:186 start_codon:yes stop_codon:yes gene_type:complete
MRKYFKGWGMFLNSSDFKRFMHEGRTAYIDHEGEGYVPKCEAQTESEASSARYRFLLMASL